MSVTCSINTRGSRGEGSTGALRPLEPVKVIEAVGVAPADVLEEKSWVGIRQIGASTACCSLDRLPTSLLERAWPFRITAVQIAMNAKNTRAVNLVFISVIHLLPFFGPVRLHVMANLKSSFS